MKAPRGCTRSRLAHRIVGMCLVAIMALSLDALGVRAEPPAIARAPAHANTRATITRVFTQPDKATNPAGKANSLPAVTNSIPDGRGDRVIDLGEAFRLAGLNNPTIGLAEEIVRANQAELTLARSLLFPTLNAGTTLSLHQGNLLSSSGVIRDVQRESLYFGAGADVRGAGTVAIPGVILATHLGDAIFAPRVARQKVISSDLDAQATHNDVLLQVASAYLNLAGAEARLLALRESEHGSKSEPGLFEVVRLTVNFAANRQGREGDVQRARSEALLLQSADIQAQEDVSRAAADLARLLSIEPASQLRSVPGLPPYVQLVDASLPLETLIQEALARRPEIGARGADVAFFETRLRQERVRPLLPTVAVGFSAGDFGGGSDLAGYRFSHFNSRADFDVVAFWTLQNLGIGNLAAQKRVRAQIGEAEAVRGRAINLVRRQVAEAVARTKAARARMDSAEKRLASSGQGFREDLLRAKNLQGRLIEVLNSFNQLNAARQDYVAALVEFSQSQFALHVALGNTPIK